MVEVDVRVRGIYATALTRRFMSTGHTVVDASPPIRRRFEAEFPTGDYDVAVETTSDRQGVGIHGSPEAVDEIRDVLDAVGTDTLSWVAPTPLGSVYTGRVTEIRGGGAIVDLGTDGGTGRPCEGYLPFDATDRYVETGDTVRVQIREPRPPWKEANPGLDTDLRVRAGPVTLVRGDEGLRMVGGGAADRREFGRIAELLDVEVLDGWGIEWSRSAIDADLDRLETALSRATERANRVESAVEEPREEPGEMISQTRGVWVWFGRESRFALDETRRQVTATMPGHHRTKAAAEAASTAVDFVEALCEPSGDFPFEIVVESFGPREGATVGIGHGKPDGRVIGLGPGEVTELDADEASITVERTMSGGGRYDGLGVPKEAGDIAVTTFREGRWWYPTVYRGDDGSVKGTYVNICTPLELFPEAVRYVDLEVDVVKYPDGTVERIDDDELDSAVAAGQLGEPLAKRARQVAEAVSQALQ